MSATKVEHPAKFSPPVIDAISTLLANHLPASDSTMIADPFAGVGGVLDVQVPERAGAVVWLLNEIEPEWAAVCQERADASTGHVFVHTGDWLLMPADFKVDVVITSPAYGNRMADNHTPGPNDKSKRITYRHKLGRPLTKNNSGGMQWGDEYREFHRCAWMKVLVHLNPGGLFVLNVSDHIRDGEKQPVTTWHKSVLRNIKPVGFELIDSCDVETRRMGFGANASARVDHESVLLFRKPL